MRKTNSEKGILTEAQLDRLGTQFVGRGIQDEYAISFETYVDLVRSNKWKEYTKKKPVLPTQAH